MLDSPTTKCTANSKVIQLCLSAKKSSSIENTAMVLNPKILIDKWKAAVFVVFISLSDVRYCVVSFDLLTVEYKQLWCFCAQ